MQRSCLMRILDHPYIGPLRRSPDHGLSGGLTCPTFSMTKAAEVNPEWLKEREESGECNRGPYTGPFGSSWNCFLSLRLTPIHVRGGLPRSFVESTCVGYHRSPFRPCTQTPWGELSACVGGASSEREVSLRHVNGSPYGSTSSGLSVSSDEGILMPAGKYTRWSQCVHIYISIHMCIYTYVYTRDLLICSNSCLLIVTLLALQPVASSQPCLRYLGPAQSADRDTEGASQPQTRT